MGGQREIIVRSKIEIFELKSATGKIKTWRFSRRLEEAELASLKMGPLKRSSLRSRKKKNKGNKRPVGANALADMQLEFQERRKLNEARNQG